jgi:hypothetical protein
MGVFMHQNVIVVLFYNVTVKLRLKDEILAISMSMQRARFHCLLVTTPNYTKLDGYPKLSIPTNDSLMLLADTNREKIEILPALSFVPLARPPPNGCCPTTAPVDFSL